MRARRPPPELLLAVALSVLPLGAAAEHEVAYRYIVLGYVRDGRGLPVAGRTVELVRDRTGFAYRTGTDDQGFFLVIARLGDESAGETLTLRVGPWSRTITARFDPANHADERGTRVDLEGARFVERAAAFRPTLARYLAEPAR